MTIIGNPSCYVDTTHASSELVISSIPYIQRKMPDNSPPYSKGSAYSLDSYSEGWVRSDAGEGPNSVPFLPIPERSRVLTYSSAPVQHGEALPLEEDDDHILVDWDSQGNTNAWVNKYTSADPQELFEPVLTCRTAPSEDGMEGYVLNNAGEYVLAGESLSTPGGATTDLWPPQEHDLPSRDLSSASSSSSSSLSWAPRASMGDRDRSSTRSEGDLGTIRGDLESSKVTRGQMLSQDIPVATRRYRRIVMDSSSSEDAREPPSTKNSSHRSQAGEERARRLFFYDGRESQGSEYLPTMVQDSRLRAVCMPNFIQVLQAKLQDHFVKVVEQIFRMKVACFGVMAMCIPILLILRGLMLGYPLMVGMWLEREDTCSSRVAFWPRVFDMLVKRDEFRYDNC
ncbi:hypothetical protein BGX38DRAFT_1157837 [Terfezia claveryi]|nr:hypothetical protein BGX38DRAFT_1157837 [Terfezia claveryi]